MLTKIEKSYFKLAYTLIKQAIKQNDYSFFSTKLVGLCFSVLEIPEEKYKGMSYDKNISK